MLLAANKDIAADHSPKTYDESTQTDCEPEMDEYEYGYTTNETKQMNEPDSGFYELSELDHTYTGSSPNSPSSTIPSEPLISNASESPIPPNILPSIIGRSDNIKVSPTVEVEFEKWSSEEDDVQLSSSQLEGFDQQTQETTQILGYMAKRLLGLNRSNT
jgi:hypothetical protein